MKNLSIIIACILVAMMSCTKSKEVHPEIGDGNDEIITVGMKDIHVEYMPADISELSKVVFCYCPADANGNAQQFAAAEMTKKETLFEIALNDLLKDTLYWYYYELYPNSGDAFNTPRKTFHTQAFDEPEPPEPPTPSGAPEGAINGLFSINEHGDQVYFSKGNLQYQATTNTWRFAENQWDYVGDATDGTVYESGVKCNNEQISSTYDGWIDLFGWGTSGWNSGANCYQPWSTSFYYGDYYPGGNNNNNLSGEYSNADWGFYNAISNGGNQTEYWRTLLKEEYDFVLNNRNTLSGTLFVKANVNDVNGVILLPDDWDNSYYSFNEANQGDVSFSSNLISLSQWNILERFGAVFFPAAGYRDGTYIGSLKTNGDYWTASYIDYWMSYGVEFSEYICYVDDDNTLNGGRTVRLAHDAK